MLSKVVCISKPHCIVALAGFKTIVFPIINDGATNRSACQYGKFHGIILPITPMGWFPIAFPNLPGQARFGRSTWDVEVTIGFELGSELIAEYTGTLKLKRGGK